MKKLIIVMHGDYSSDENIEGDHLNDEGRAQITALANKLKQLLQGASVLIISSTADRASESAAILGSALGVGFTGHDVLRTEGCHENDFRGTLELVRECNNLAEALILVTQEDHAEYFPVYFAIRELGLGLYSFYGRTGKGEAWIIDCEQKSLARLPQNEESQIKDIREDKETELDELQAETEQLLALLKCRQMKPYSWHHFLRERVQDLQASLASVQKALDHAGFTAR